MPSFSHLRKASFHAKTQIPIPLQSLQKLFSPKKQEKMWLFPKSPLLISFGHPKEPKQVSLSLHTQGLKTNLQGTYTETRSQNSLTLQGRLQDGKNGCLENIWHLSLSDNTPKTSSKKRKHNASTTLSLSLTTHAIGGRIAHIDPRHTQTFWQNLLLHTLAHMEKTALHEIKQQKPSSRLSHFIKNHPRLFFITLILSLFIALFLLA